MKLIPHHLNNTDSFILGWYAEDSSFVEDLDNYYNSSEEKFNGTFSIVVKESEDVPIVFGDGSQGEYTIDEWAKACGTINYEIVTRIGVRVPRIYSRE